MSVHKLIHLLYFSGSNPEEDFLSSSTDDHCQKTAQKRNSI